MLTLFVYLHVIVFKTILFLSIDTRDPSRCRVQTYKKRSYRVCITRLLPVQLVHWWNVLLKVLLFGSSFFPVLAEFISLSITHRPEQYFFSSACLKPPESTGCIYRCCKIFCAHIRIGTNSLFPALWISKLPGAYCSEHAF